MTFTTEWTGAPHIGPGGHPVKRDTKTGRILNVKADLTPFKGVRCEK